MKAHEAQTKIEKHYDAQEKKEIKVKRLAVKLHYLVSTKAVDGVYNGVYTKNYKISNLKVDDYLRQTLKVC